MLDSPISASLEAIEAAAARGDDPSSALGWRSPARPPKPPASNPSLCSFFPPDTAAAWPVAGSGRSLSFSCLMGAGVLVEGGCTLVHCSLPAQTRVGEGAYLYGINSPPTACFWPASLVAHEVSLSAGAT
eukprot:4314656-Prymnesium_polylepis.1